MSAGNAEATLERSGTGMGFRKVSQIVKYSDFTDGGGTDGTLNMNKKVPAGSFVIGSKVTVSEGFVGDTTATLTVGTAGDANEYSGNTTHNILAKARNLVKSAFIGADAGLVAEGADISVLLTVAGGADFGAITAGKMLIEVFYLSTNLELTDGPTEEIQLNKS